MPLFDRVRLDPELAFGASRVGGQSGLWAFAEVEVLVKVAEWASLEVGGGIDLRRYARAGDVAGVEERFDARALRFEVGLAVHDLLGFGANRF